MKANFQRAACLVAFAATLASLHFARLAFADEGKGREAGIPAGVGEMTLALGETRLAAFTYKPPTFREGPLLVVFHGMLRNADDYRDNAKEIADKLGAVVVAPQFDLKRFSFDAYQLGGLKTDAGELAPRDKWTWQLVPRLTEEIRRREGRPDMPYYYIGHSAGGQFLGRLAGFVPTDARRIVVANPGTHLFASLEKPFPYGFGDLPHDIANEQALKRFLAQPVTLYLGTADVKSENLDDSEQAQQQGATRHARGLNAFRTAKELATKKGWKFNWQLVEAPDIGHNAKAMFNHPQCEKALLGPSLPSRKSRTAK